MGGWWRHLWLGRVSSCFWQLQSPTSHHTQQLVRLQVCVVSAQRQPTGTAELETASWFNGDWGGRCCQRTHQRTDPPPLGPTGSCQQTDGPRQQRLQEESGAEIPALLYRRPVCSTEQVLSSRRRFYLPEEEVDRVRGVLHSENAGSGSSSGTW